MRLLLLLLVCVLGAGALPGATPDASPPPPPTGSTTATAQGPLGCWRAAPPTDLCVLFAADHLVLHQQGQTVVAPVRYEPGAFIMSFMGQTARIPYTRSGDQLTLTVHGQQVALQATTTIPASIRDAQQPFVLGTGVADAARIAAVRQSLAQRQVEDQAVRIDPRRRSEMAKVDADNTAYLRAQVAAIGWIDVARFGVEASNTAFLLVQHSGDLQFMQACLPAIERDLKAKRLPDGQPYALLYDRVQLYLGKPQRFGSQLVSSSTGEMVVYDLEDPAHVDQRRAAIGMVPLAQYLSSFASANGGKGVRLPTP